MLTKKEQIPLAELILACQLTVFTTVMDHLSQEAHWTAVTLNNRTLARNSISNKSCMTAMMF